MIKGKIRILKKRNNVEAQGASRCSSKEHVGIGPYCIDSENLKLLSPMKSQTSDDMQNHSGYFGLK
jgi:hypothetical protein